MKRLELGLRGSIDKPELSYRVAENAEWTNVQGSRYLPLRLATVLLELARCGSININELEGLRAWDKIDCESLPTIFGRVRRRSPAKNILEVDRSSRPNIIRFAKGVAVRACESDLDELTPFLRPKGELDPLRQLAHNDPDAVFTLLSKAQTSAIAVLARSWCKFFSNLE